MEKESRNKDSSNSVILLVAVCKMYIQKKDVSHQIKKFRKSSREFSPTETIIVILLVFLVALLIVEKYSDYQQQKLTDADFELDQIKELQVLNKTSNRVKWKLDNERRGIALLANLLHNINNNNDNNNNFKHISSNVAVKKLPETEGSISSRARTIARKFQIRFRQKSVSYKKHFF